MFKRRLEVHSKRQLGLEHGVRLWVHRIRRSFAFLAQIVIWAVWVKALVPRSDDAHVTSIADDVRVNDVCSSLHLRIGDVIGRFAELDKGMTRVRVLDGRAADVATIPVGAVEAFPPGANDALRAEIAGSRVSGSFILIIGRELDSILEPSVQHRFERVSRVVEIGCVQ